MSSDDIKGPANEAGDLPNNQLELQVQNAKAYLLQTSTKSNTNL